MINLPLQEGSDWMLNPIWQHEFLTIGAAPLLFSLKYTPASGHLLRPLPNGSLKVHFALTTGCLLLKRVLICGFLLFENNHLETCAILVTRSIEQQKQQQTCLSVGTSD